MNSASERINLTYGRINSVATYSIPQPITNSPSYNLTQLRMQRITNSMRNIPKHLANVVFAKSLANILLREQIPDSILRLTKSILNIAAKFFRRTLQPVTKGLLDLI